MEYDHCTNAEPHPWHHTAQSICPGWGSQRSRPVLTGIPQQGPRTEEQNASMPAAILDAREYGTDSDGLASGQLRSTVGRALGEGRRKRRSVPKSYFRRKQHGLALWIKKHLTRTITRLEHGHGPGTLTRFGGTYPGYDWKCERCGEHAEW